MRVAARAAGVLVGLACLGAGDPAPLGFDLRWSAPSECPSAERVRADIERLTSRKLGAAQPDGVSVSATVASETSGNWTLDLAISLHPGERRERRLEGGTCREVADAAAVIVALALDAGHTELPPPSPPPPPPPPPPRPRPQPPQPPPPPPPVAPKPRVTWALAAEIGVDAFALGKPAPGAGLVAAIGFPAGRVELRGMAWLPRSAELTPSSGADVALFAGAARFCHAFVERTLEIAGCAGVEVGALRGAGYGLRHNDVGIAPWVAPEIGVAALVHPARHFAISLEIEGLLPIERDNFVVDGAPVFRPPIGDGRAFFGLRFDGP